MMGAKKLCSLKHMSTMALAADILDVFEKARSLDGGPLTALQGRYLEDILDYMFQFDTGTLPGQLIMHLVPAYLKNFSPRNHICLSTEHLAGILNKFYQLKVLLLKNCNSLNIGEVILKASSALTCLVKLKLHRCRSLTDQHVQVLLRICPSIRHLIFQHCLITGDSFLVNELHQEAIETVEQAPIPTDRFLCKLETVDVFGCESFCNDGVRHLCSLSGPWLRSVDVQLTPVCLNGTAFFSGIFQGPARFCQNRNIVSKEEEAELEICQPLFTPNLLSLAIDISVKETCQRSRCHGACFKVFLQSNPRLKQLKLYRPSEFAFQQGCGASFEDDEVVGILKNSGLDLEHLSVTSDDDVEFGPNMAISKLLHTFTKLKTLDLNGCNALRDAALQPLRRNHCLTSLDLSTLQYITTVPFHKASLLDLNLSWCEDLEITALNHCLSQCLALRRLILHHCKITDSTLQVLARNCHHIRELDVSRGDDLTDVAVIDLARGLPALTSIDLSDNPDLTDHSIKALLTECPLLKAAMFANLLHITDQPFLPLIADWQSWVCEAPRCKKAIVNVEARESENNTEKKSLLGLSGFRRRSVSHATCLEFVDLTGCHRVKDINMRWIVEICRGLLHVRGYHGERIERARS